MLTAIHWTLIASTAIGKVVAFVVLVIFAIAVPLTRIEIALRRRAAGTAREVAKNLAVAAFGVLGVFILLENARIFLAAAL